MGYGKMETYSDRIDDMNGSAPPSVGSNQGLDLSPFTSQRTSPTAVTNGSPQQSNEEQTPVGLGGVAKFETKFTYKTLGPMQEGYISPGVQERTDLHHDSDSATVSAKSQPMDDQEEALNMSVDKKDDQSDDGDGNSENVSVSAAKESVTPLRMSPLEQSEMNMSYLHRNNLLTVSHSMT